MSQLDRYENVKFTDREGNVSTPVINDVQELHEFSSNLRNVDLVGHIVYNNKKVEVLISGNIKQNLLKKYFVKNLLTTIG